MILGVILVLSGYYTWDNFAKLIKSGFSSRPDSGTVRIQRPVLWDHSGVSTFTELTISLILI